MEKTIKNFEKFTNLYELSKTLRFELKSEEKTKEILEVENEKRENFKKDREIKGAYPKIKKFLDDLHSKFIEKSLCKFSFKKDDLKEFFEKYKKEKKKISDTELKKLENKIAKNFNEYKEELNDDIILSKKNILDKSSLDILKYYHQNCEEDLKIINIFKKFYTYLSGYKQNRENYYKKENRAGQFATRAIKDDFLKFLNNKIIFEKYYQNKISELGFDINEIKIFDLEHYNSCLLQNGIDKYNTAIGGSNKQDNVKIQGLNEKINLYRQNIKTKDKKNFKGSQYPFFEELYKQVASPKNKEIRFLEINNDEDLVKELKNFIVINTPKRKLSKNILNKFFNYQKNEFDLNKIYLPASKTSKISRQVFSNWQKLTSIYRADNEDKKKDYVSFGKIKEYLNDIDKEDLNFRQFYKKQNVYSEKKDNFENFLTILKYEFQILFDGGNSVFAYEDEDEKNKKHLIPLASLEKDYLEAIDWFEEKIAKKIKISEEKENKFITAIKEYLDRILEISRMADIFYLKDEWKNKIGEENLDQEFYRGYNEYKKEVVDYNPSKYYDEFRNYVTQRGVEDEKFKLNFDCVQLLKGWDKNEEEKKLGVIFEKDDLFYLGVINKDSNDIFDEKKHPEIFVKSSNYKKMEYKCLGDAKRQIPRIAFSEKAKNGKECFNPNDKIISIKEEWDKFRKAKREDKNNLNKKFDSAKIVKLISYYQEVLEKHSEKYKKVYCLRFKKPSDYKGLGDFFEDTEKQLYKLDFVGINKNYVDEKVANGELYLFQIYNKDFSPNKKENSLENLHTIYFKELFSKENLKNPVFKLSGGAEMFFRDKTDNIKLKYYKKNGKEITSEKSIDKDKKVIQHRRYAENKILFHLPIIINFSKEKAGKGYNRKFNSEINEFIVRDKDKNIKILGIDRGEKHLAYYSLINQDGNIKESGSLNEVNGVNYYQKLKEKAKERDFSRRNWQKIEGIKNLKDGYISAVVKKIADLAVENNAIIVFEDLNMRFKQKRGGVFEPAVYQKLEKALIEKFNFLADKKLKNHRKALQLTSPFTTFQNMGKQTGIIFYTQASYTSITCPKCGWRKRAYVYYRNVKQMIADLEKINFSIFYEKGKNRFGFKFNSEEKYRKDKKDEKYIVSKKDNLVYSDIERRYRNSKFDNNKGKSEFLGNGEITKELKNLFKDKFEISLRENENLFEQLKEKNQPNNYASAWKSFVIYFNRILNIRNSNSGNNGDEDDFILCPHCHFDSRGKNAIIKNGDDNGAYNIARRGKMIIERIKNFTNNLSELRDKDLHISKKDWDKFTQSRQIKK